MDLQLELLPYDYYNTLGFDAELIDYNDHVNDDVVRELVDPLYKQTGRRPINPITYFRMHYLYFTKPEVSSFRQLEKLLKDPKNHAWRNFIGVSSIFEVPCHGSLSIFRKTVGPELFLSMLFTFVIQAMQLGDFIETTLAGIDSRPVYAGVNGYKKKRCTCDDQSLCSCEATYSDPDATIGCQRNKAN